MLMLTLCVLFGKKDGLTNVLPFITASLYCETKVEEKVQVIKTRPTISSIMVLSFARLMIISPGIYRRKRGPATKKPNEIKPKWWPTVVAIRPQNFPTNQQTISIGPILFFVRCNGGVYSGLHYKWGKCLPFLSPACQCGMILPLLKKYLELPFPPREQRIVWTFSIAKKDTPKGLAAS